MILAKGYVFQLLVSNDPKTKLRHCHVIELARLRWLFMQDPQGREIARCNVIIQQGRMVPQRAPSRITPEAAAYFGDVPISEMDREIPNVRGVAWSTVGYCRQIYYDRISARMLETGEDPFQHPYKANSIEYDNAFLSVASIKGKRTYLLQLGPSCIVNERGFVKP